MRESVTVRGHEIAFVHLPGAGLPIVLVHGVGSSIETWDDVPERLAAAGHPVVAVDLIGHGESGLGNGDYSLGANAAAIRDLLDHLGYQRVHLVGHSLGGGVSMQFTYQFPDRVETLTLVSSGGLGPDVAARLRVATLPGAKTVIRAMSAKRAIGAASWVGRRLDDAGMQVEAFGQRAVSRIAALHDEGRSDAFLATLRSVVGYEGQRVSALQKLDAIDPTSVLVIWGSEDSMIPATHAWDAHEQLPGSRIVIVPGASHHPHTDDPDLFVRAVLEHVGARVTS